MALTPWLLKWKKVFLARTMLFYADWRVREEFHEAKNNFNFCLRSWCLRGLNNVEEKYVWAKERLALSASIRLCLWFTYILAFKRNLKIAFQDSIFKSLWMKEINLNAGHLKTWKRKKERKKCNRLRPCGSFTNNIQREKTFWRFIF